MKVFTIEAAAKTGATLDAEHDRVVVEVLGDVRTESEGAPGVFATAPGVFATALTRDQAGDLIDQLVALL